MTQLKEKIKEFTELAKDCPANLQETCFRLLLEHHLSSSGQKKQNAEDKIDGQDKAKDATVEPGKASRPPRGSESKQEDISEADLHLKVKKFLSSNTLSLDQLNQIFYREDGKFLPLYEDLKTTKLAESQVRISLLQALRNAIPNGEFECKTEDIRQECKDRKCYDSPNFSANFSNKGGLFDFAKFGKDTATFKLSNDGKKALAALIKELNT